MIQTRFSEEDGEKSPDDKETKTYAPDVDFSHLA
jgi:hypothetical protein